MTADIFKVGQYWYINYLINGEFIRNEYVENLMDAVTQTKAMGCTIVTMYFDEEAMA